jgi:hypothetical protein
MDAFERPLFDLTQVAVWALTREPAAVGEAADEDNPYAILDVKEAHLALDELYERLWGESGLSRPDDPRRLKIDILAGDVDPADLPPPFDERRAERMRQLEVEGKVRIRRDNSFPIVDYLTLLFQTGRLEALVQPEGEAVAFVIPAADWAFLEVVGGDHQRLFVRRIGERGDAFGTVRVRREQVLAVFPPVEATDAPKSPRPAGRARGRRQPELLDAVEEALMRHYPFGPQGRTREQLASEIAPKIGAKSISLSTLDRAKAKAKEKGWPSGSSDFVR